MTDTRLASIITAYQQRLSAKPYITLTTDGRETLGASCTPNKLFIAFLFSDHNVGVHFLKDVGLIPIKMVSCKCGSQMSRCVDSDVKDGYR
jgi:hypothetical protein